MKLHQNRLDRFSVIAKQLVDRHSEAYFNDCTKRTDIFDAYNDHLNTLGEQLEQKATEFLKSCRTANEELRKEIWTTCTKYIELFIQWNSPGRVNQYIS
ncbi:MAG: hypothetical protein H6551_11415 [Chitinophagales bacterium]|nr:hypothetical protein [Chitinophagaceae bacterium]MCB9065735.1 hypothetical protein [Chitinophagales bacterium]